MYFYQITKNMINYAPIQNRCFILLKGRGTYAPGKTKQAFDMIELGVHNIYESDNFQHYLKVLSKFHNYSLNNQRKM